MKTADEIKAKLKELRAFYEERRKMLRIANGKVRGDYEFRKTVLMQMYDTTVEIANLEQLLAD